MSGVRDFITLHYKATQRDDSAFWRQCRDMEIPRSLQDKIDLYASNGRVFREGTELFAQPSWVQVMQGQGIRPQSYHPLIDFVPREQISEFLGDVERVIEKCVDIMATHAEFIAQRCAASGQ